MTSAIVFSWLAPSATASRPLLSPLIVIRSVTAQTPSVAKLAEQLATGDLQARREAAWALAQLGPAAEVAVPELIDAARERDSQLGNGALQALGMIGQAADSALDVVAKQLKSGDEQRRYRAAFALGRIAASDASQVVAGLEDPSAAVRAATAEAVGWMNERAQPHLPILIRLLGDDSAPVAEAAVRSLRRLDQIAVPALSATLAATSPPFPDETAVERCVAIIGDIGPAAQMATPHLVRLAAMKSTKLRAAAIIALSQVSSAGSVDSAVMDLVVAGLTVRETEVRQAAISAIIRLRGDQVDSAAVAPLVACLDADTETAKLAAFALGRLDHVAEAAVPELLRRVQDHPQAGIDAPSPARISLSQLGPIAIPYVLEAHQQTRLPSNVAAEIIVAMGPRALPTVRSKLRDPQPLARALALRCIGKLAPAGESLPSLRLGLNDPDAPVRQAAAVGLQALGRAGQSAADDLIGLVQDSDVGVRGAALTAITSLGIDDERVIPLVQAGLTDESPRVRELAAISARGLSHPTSALFVGIGKQLNDDIASVQLAAAETLATQEQLPTEIGQYLTAAYANGSPRIKKWLLAAMGQLAGRR